MLLPGGVFGSSTNPETVSRNRRRQKLSPLNAALERARCRKANQICIRIRKIKGKEGWEKASDAEKEAALKEIRNDEQARFERDKIEILKQYEAQLKVKASPPPPPAPAPIPAPLDSGPECGLDDGGEGAGQEEGVPDVFPDYPDRKNNGEVCEEGQTDDVREEGQTDDVRGEGQTDEVCEEVKSGEEVESGEVESDEIDKKAIDFESDEEEDSEAEMQRRSRWLYMDWERKIESLEQRALEEDARRSARRRSARRG